MTRDTHLDPGFDPRIADWLEADPHFAPAQVLETVLSAAPSIPQRRRLSWLPRRTTSMNRLLLAGAAIATLFAVVVGGSLVNGPPGPIVGTSPTPVTPSVSAPAPVGSPSPAPLGGRILIEHFGNAPDGSEQDFENVNPDKRRLYLADPNDIGPATLEEFLPGRPTTGKTAADVAVDGTKVTFQDWADPSRIYEANIDGTAFRALTPDDCGCSEWDPAYDPTGTRVAYGRSEGDEAWLEIRDLESGGTTRLESTVGPSADAVPESPSWSPDGTKIVFARTTWGDVEPFMGTVHYGDPASAGVLSIVDVGADTVTDLPAEGLVAGDPDWSPDGSLIVFTEHPMTKGGGSGDSHGIYTIRPDGSGLSESLVQGDSATWTADGRILYSFNRLYLIEPDGSGRRLVDPGATDNTETNIGYVYVAYWVGTP